MTPRHLDTPLGEYLKEALTRKWEWGVHDCSAWPALWAGIDLPDYECEGGALAHIADHGGLVALWEYCIDGVLERATEATFGDVAIIQAVNRDGEATEVGAIWNGRRWSFLTPNGLGGASATPLAIWSVPCPKQ